MTSKKEVKSPVVRPTLKQVIEKSPSYQFIMSSPEVRTRMAEYVLKAAAPAAIGYTSIDDRVCDEFNIENGRTACRHILAVGKERMQKFLIDNLLHKDKAYIEFMSNQNFNEKFLAGLSRHDLEPESYLEDPRKHNEVILPFLQEIEQEFGIDAFYFTKYILSDRKLYNKLTS